jgi:hypothetical protein
MTAEVNPFQPIDEYILLPTALVTEESVLQTKPGIRAGKNSAEPTARPVY